MKHTDNILLYNLWNNPLLSHWTKPYYKYLSIKNNFSYQYTKVLDLENYDILIGINNFCIANTILFKDFVLEQLKNFILILPQDIHCPLNMTPFIAKNCPWFQNFFKKYTESKTHSLYNFLSFHNLLDSKFILRTDKWASYNQTSIITNLINLSIDEIKSIFIQNNSLLEIVT